MGKGVLDDHDDEDTTAKELNVSKRTLRRWRQEGKGPPYVGFARQIYYPQEERKAWLKSLIVRPVRSRRVG